MLSRLLACPTSWIFDPCVTIAAIVSEKICRSVGGSDEQVPVGRRCRCRRRAAPLPTIGFAKSDADFVDRIREFAVCVVMKQVRQLGISDLRLNGVDVIFHVSVGGKDIKVSIEIKVKEETCEGKRQ